MNIKITPFDPTPDNIGRFKKLYEATFPIDERRPWTSILSMLTGEHDFFRPYSIADEGKEIGFITTWDFPEMVYVEHFAIDPAARGNGAGSKAVTQLIGSTDKPLALEVEPATMDDTARKRINFYRRLGFIDRPEYDYIQPPYSTATSAVPMTIMTRGDLDPATVARTLLRHVYR